MQEQIFYNLQPEELRTLIKSAVTEALAGHQSSQQQQPEPEELLRVNQLAEFLHVSKVTIHNWKRKGLIPFHRLSNKVFFKKSEVISSLKKSRKV